MSYVGKAVAIDIRTFVFANGHSATVARFRRGMVSFSLHVGSRDPSVGPAGVPFDAGPAISTPELAVILGAFNGGFYISSGAGGFEVDGITLSPLKDGEASFVIDQNGTGHVGVWGQDLPARGEKVLSVRQNLPPLIASGRPAANINDVAAWGGTLNHATVVSRGALGEDAAGNILYAGSGTGALPVDMAQALMASGALQAMELDINPEWVQLDLAPVPGGCSPPSSPGSDAQPTNI